MTPELVPMIDRPRVIALMSDLERATRLQRRLVRRQYDVVLVATPLDLLTRLEWHPLPRAVVLDGPATPAWRALADFLHDAYPRTRLVMALGSFHRGIGHALPSA